jgi:fermentation-respiration switch protein FrsA (DUF1100 family)
VDIDNYEPDSLAANDAAPFIEAGLTVDTFRVETDGLTQLACLSVIPSVDSVSDSTHLPRGTAILLHDDHEDRNSLIGFAGRLVDSGYAVIVYDQRASGVSTGKYHGDGQHEADDLIALLAYLDLRELLYHPVTAVGFSLGGDAALLASLEEQRLDRVVAVSPYLTCRRMIDQRRAELDSYWIPFFRTIMWWWYQIRSGYATSYRVLDDIEPVGMPTLVLAGADQIGGPEVSRLKEVSDPAGLTLIERPSDLSACQDEIVAYLFR